MSDPAICQYLPWIDLETTGLDPRADIILEVGVVVTDLFLNFVSESNWIVRPTAGVPRLDQRVWDMHIANGLLRTVIADGLPIDRVEEQVGEYLDTWFPLASENKPPIAGFTPQFDRGFLAVHCPKLIGRFNHRVFDVSTFKHAHRAWIGELPKDESPHRALEDCRAAISACDTYRKMFRTFATTQETPK